MPMDKPRLSEGSRTVGWFAALGDGHIDTWPWEPPVPSLHLELLDRLVLTALSSWADRALRAALEGVRNGPLIENISYQRVD